jgi:hypothetical protein
MKDLPSLQWLFGSAVSRLLEDITIITMQNLAGLFDFCPSWDYTPVGNEFFTNNLIGW